MNNVNGSDGSKDALLCLPAGPYFTMNWIYTAALTLGLALPSSGTPPFVNTTEYRQIKRDIEELSEIALHCGKKETKRLHPTAEYPVVQYSLFGSIPTSPYFTFYDGNQSTIPNGKVDLESAAWLDGFSLGQGSFQIIDSLNSPLGSIGTISDKRKVQQILHYLKNNLPPECYQKDSDFNCC